MTGLTISRNTTLTINVGVPERRITFSGFKESTNFDRLAVSFWIYCDSSSISVKLLIWDLLICQKSKIDDWVDHFTEYYPDYKVYNLTKKTQSIMFRRYMDGEHIADDESVLGVINYEGIPKRFLAYVPAQHPALTL